MINGQSFVLLLFKWCYSVNWNVNISVVSTLVEIVDVDLEQVLDQLRVFHVGGDRTFVFGDFICLVFLLVDLVNVKNLALEIL